MKTLLLLLLRVYKLGISPYLGQNCRFYPSCSEYAAEAIREHGALRGGALATRRLCKCHPWHPGGVDPVPQKTADRFAPDAGGWLGSARAWCRSTRTWRRSSTRP